MVVSTAGGQGDGTGKLKSNNRKTKVRVKLRNPKLKRSRVDGSLLCCSCLLCVSLVLSSGCPRVSHLRPAPPSSVPPVILSAFSLCQIIVFPSICLLFGRSWTLAPVFLLFFFVHFLHYYLQCFICLSLQCGSKLGVSLLQNAQQWPSFLWLSKKCAFFGVLNQFGKNSATELLHWWFSLSFLSVY